MTFREIGKFHGFELSDIELEKGRVSYSTLAKAVDNMIYCSRESLEAMEQAFGYMELWSGEEINEDGNYHEIAQYFVTDKYGARMLNEYTDEIVYHMGNSEFYVWGIVHCGTSWDYVMTCIDIDEEW